MTAEELKSLLEDKENIREKLTESMIFDVLSFFEADSESGAVHYHDFLSFIQYLSEFYGVHYIREVHFITIKYLLVLKDSPDVSANDLARAYVILGEYYLCTNIYPECIRNIFSVLRMKGQDEVYTSAVLSMLITLFYDNGMFMQSEPYLSSMEEILFKGSLKKSDSFFAALGLMYSYAVIGKTDKSEYFRDYLEKNIIKEMPEEWKALFDAYKMSSHIRIDANYATSDSILSEYQEVIGKILSTKVLDSFSNVFIPIFNCVRGLISEKELVDNIMSIVELTYLNADKIRFYRYMIYDLKLDREKYPEIFNRYYAQLEQYFVDDCTNQRNVIESEIMEHEESELNRRFSITDALTGIENRRAFDRRLEDMSCDREKIPEGLALIVADVNGLKERNDNFGHDAGDALIRKVSETLVSVFSDIGKVYRIGGDEFAAIVAGSYDRIDASVETLKKISLSQENLQEGISMSIGWEGYDNIKSSSTTVEKMSMTLKVADERMYEDKNSYYIRTGKDRRRRR